MVRSDEGRDRGGRSRSGERRSARYQEEDDGRRDGTSPWVLVACVAVILLFVIGVFIFLYRTFLSGLFALPETYTVPDLVGHTYEEVYQNTELLQDHFTVVLGETVEDDAEAGTIIDQSPKADSSVGTANTEITVTVSAGPTVVYMPDVRDMEYRLAYVEIQKMGLKIGKTDSENSDEIEKDHVISTAPLPDTPVAPGTEVDLVISLGAKVETFPMFNLVGMTQAEAESQIVLKNLEVGTITPVYSDTVEAGVVVDQYPSVLTEVQEGTKINLNVSQGPDPSSVPQNVTKTVDINLPDTGGVVNVQILMDGSVVCNEDVDTALQLAVPVTVTAPSGSSKMLIVYVDGGLYSSVPVTFEP